MPLPPSPSRRVAVLFTALAASGALGAVPRAARASGVEAHRDDPPRATDDARARDGLFIEAAALPPAGTVRVAAGGTAESAPDRSGAAATMRAGVLWTLAPRVAALAGGTLYGADVFPSAGLRVHLLDGARAPVDLALSVRYRGIGPELAGPQLDARVSASRSFGVVLVVANVEVGHGVGARRDVDIDGSVAASTALAYGLRAGLEARARGELVDAYETEEDLGRPVGVAGGPVLSWRYDRVQAQALAGWSLHRGPSRSGPTALAAVSVDF